MENDSIRELFECVLRERQEQMKKLQKIQAITAAESISRILFFTLAPD